MREESSGGWGELTERAFLDRSVTARNKFARDTLESESRVRIQTTRSSSSIRDDHVVYVQDQSINTQTELFRSVSECAACAATDFLNRFP